MAARNELKLSEQISALEKRVAEKVSNETKVIDHNGQRLGSVKLRLKKLTDGRIRFYLDIYRNAEGSSKKREYQFLNCYLTPSLVKKTVKVVRKTRVEVIEVGQANETAIANAETARAKLFDIIRNGLDVKAIEESQNGITLLEWMEQYRLQKLETGQSNERALSVGKVMAHLKAYAGESVKLCDVDKDFCKGFIGYLSNAHSGKHTKAARPLASSTANVYFQIFSSAMTEALKEEKIKTNPASLLTNNDKKPIRAKRSNRTFLTIDEVKKLAGTEYTKNDDVKRAFLFSCFTGLRISDVENLKWSNITKHDGGCLKLSIRMQKTGEPLTIKLNNQAIGWLPEKRGTDEVFDLPYYKATINERLKSWAKKAGIEKDVCFHMSRHTFATMELTLGADLYVVSKLLGHTNVGTTQIYADIVNKRRDEAVELIDNAF